jgi:uncharacterized damage-inducible protein DinB
LPKPPIEKALILVRPRVRSREVASFFAQLDDQSRRMFSALASCGPPELAWQPRRGMNTIGMLMAHCAIVEAFWLLLASGRTSSADTIPRVKGAIGVGFDLDGLPLAAGALPPRSLAGWTLPRYRRLHDRARAFAKRTARVWRDEDLDPTFRSRRANGNQRVLNVRWILYHVLEHQAGHFGQMLLLRHQYADRRKR